MVARWWSHQRGDTSSHTLTRGMVAFGGVICICRFPPPAAAGLAAMLLASFRGSYKSGRDSIDTIK